MEVKDMKTIIGRSIVKTILLGTVYWLFERVYSAGYKAAKVDRDYEDYLHRKADEVF